MTTPWENNHVQFCRLLAEMAMVVDFTTPQLAALRESMDLEQEEIDALFDRAMIEFERVKVGKPVRTVTPEREIETFNENRKA